MKRTIQAVLTALLIIVITLAAVFTLVRATIIVADLPSRVARAIAGAIELIFGVGLLLGTIYVATHLAVRIYGTTHSGGRRT